MKVINNISALCDRRKELRNNATPQETLLWQKLKHSQLGSKFRRQHSIGGYIVDFYCPAKRLVIEIDGAQHLREENMEYDAVRSKYFEGLDVSVIRFNNVEIDTDIDRVLQKILRELNFVSPPYGGGE